MMHTVFEIYSGVHRGNWEGDRRAEHAGELLGSVPPPACIDPDQSCSARRSASQRSQSHADGSPLRSTTIPSAPPCTLTSFQRSEALTPRRTPAAFEAPSRVEKRPSFAFA